jgi:hypothetical protein
MNPSNKLVLSLSAAAVLLGVVTASPAHAVFMQQSQQMSGSANASSTCTGGDCNTSAQTSINTSMSQTMSADMGGGPAYAPSYAYVNTVYRTRPSRMGYARVQQVYVVENNNGQVRLDWGYRGGTCHVRYTEATSANYKYFTSAGCDEGGVTISGLVPGRKYRFQVRQNEGAWSRAVVVKAG